MSRIRRIVLLVGLGTFAAPVSAQVVPVRALTEPTAALAQGFTRIASIHELTDHRVVMLDSDDRVVYIVSADLSSASSVGRSGAGPGEYQFPTRLLGLAGDTTAVLDIANSRLLIISPVGTPGDIADLRYAPPGLGASAAILRSPMASDESGRLYAEAEPVAVSSDGTRSLVDSSAIIRWRVGTSPDTVAFVAKDVSRSQLAGSMVISSTLPPFAQLPRWSVAPDGRVAVVYPDPYHVVFYAPLGSRLEGPVIPYSPLRVTDRHKQAYRENAQRPRPALVTRLRESSSTVTVMRPPFREPSDWPDRLPPFVAHAEIRFAPDGKLWVERTLPAPDQPPVYDVIDVRGRVVEQVRVPAGTRLVGFGADVVYLVRRDDVDLEYLERYRLRPPQGTSAGESAGITPHRGKAPSSRH